MSADSNSIHLANVAANAALDKKATDVIAVDVSGVLVITDVFVICSGANSRHTAAIVDEVERQVRAAGGLPARREGKRDATWVLLDFTDIVVHVQMAEDRDLYGLERLWRDCPRIELELETEPSSTASEEDDPADVVSIDGEQTQVASVEDASVEDESVEDESSENLAPAEEPS